MKKNGFTLVELLAVIAILAILVIIALPNVMSLFNNAKKQSFTNEVKNIYKVAEQQWISDSMFETNEKVYSKCSSEECPDQLKLSGRSNINYYVKLNKLGKIVEYYVEDGTYQYSYKGGGLDIKDIGEVQQISDLSENEVITITCDNSKTIYWAKYGMPNINTEGYDNPRDAMRAIGQDFCFKFIVVDGVIKEKYLAIKKYNDIYYLKGGDNGLSYEDNKQLLNSLYSGCTQNTNSIKCYYNGVTIVAQDNGNLAASVRPKRCEIQGSTAFCDDR